MRSFRLPTGALVGDDPMRSARSLSPAHGMMRGLISAAILQRIGGLVGSLLLMVAPVVWAQPAVIYDLGGKFDKSFSEMAYTGAKRWGDETGRRFLEIELQSEAQREQALRRFAERGANPVVMVGFTFATTLEIVAPDYPETNFVIIDSVVEAPNVRSVVFNEHEASYLVGVMAGHATRTDTVGIVGGMDIPLIRRVACGYALGVKAANSKARVIRNMTGTTSAAWKDPIKGAELTRSQVAQKADVVFAAAGGTNVGILQAAADEGILSIGADSNQNHLHPGSVLTSMLKRVDNIVYEAFKGGEAAGAGVVVMGLANGGLGVALDENNADLVDAKMKAAVDEAFDAIASGRIVVHNYTDDSNCPADP